MASKIICKSCDKEVKTLFHKCWVSDLRKIIYPLRP